MSRTTLYWLGFFVALASIGSFWISAALERARRAWEADGAVVAVRGDYVRRYAVPGLVRGLALLMMGLILAIATFIRS